MHEKFIETITTSILYLEFKENNENDMVAYGFIFIFITGPSRSKLDRMATKRLLTLASLP